MSIITAAEISTWDRFYRANFINSLSGYKPVSLIGTVNANGQPNLSVVSNIVHIGADPALIGYINRPRKAAPHTIANIELTGQYTINHIRPDFIDKAHMTSAKYPENISEFEAVGLTPEYIEGIRAPFVKESSVKYALILRDIIPIPLNDTSLVIGEIVLVSLDDKIISSDGFLDLTKALSVCSNGIDGYYSTEKLSRFAYAKPWISSQPIE
jgi:flavin reductase (DIM6/NTAB) family NADH-FMN oxidoreductase RutF